MPKCVTYVPGIKWYLCVRKLILQNQQLRQSSKGSTISGLYHAKQAASTKATILPVNDGSAFFDAFDE